MKRVCDFITRWMGVLVLATAVTAYLFPETFSQLKPRLINPFLGIVMFGMGLTLNAEDFKIVLSRPKDIIIGCLAQFTIMPLLAFVLTQTFQLGPELSLGVILVGCCPGGTASNVITYLSKGDLALSVGMTSLSTLLAPLLTPFLTWAMAGTYVNVDVANMFLSILWVVILPISVGLLAQYFFKNKTQQIAPYLPAFSSLTIALIVGIIIAANSINLHKGSLIIAIVVILHNLCGLGLGYGIGWILGLPFKKKVAISIEVGMQNSGLASSLATMQFALYPMATIPGALFSIWHNLSGALVARFYAQKGKIEKE